jgi:phage FluMu gp28-like protein
VTPRLQSLEERVARHRLKTLRALFLVQNLDLEGATGVEGARWEHFQIEHLNYDGTFSIEDKSRQIAWSWTVAAEAVANAILEGTGTQFVSINLEEAKEKILYARAVYENLRVAGLPRQIGDNQLVMKLDNGARLISHPSVPPRGKAKMNMVGDEFAHIKRDREIYRAMLPVVSKGGRVRLGSSPMGASGIFWEIFSEKLRRYPGYRRKKTPWWEVQYFCLNVPEALKLAPHMDTATRVEIFATDRLKEIYENMLLEDFQQEYEAEFVDETTAWIGWDEIAANQSPDILCAMARMHGTEASNVYDAINQVAAWLRTHQIERVMAAGVDIGRTRNSTEIFLIGFSTTRTFPLRLTLTLDNVEFDGQQEILIRVLKMLPVVKMLIDRNGIGRNLAENMVKKYPGKVEGVDFTNATKQLWATDIKMLFQQKRVPIPMDRDLAYQIHSIKKKVTPSKNLVFDTERNEKHHADKFWALALALAGIKGPISPAPATAGRRQTNQLRQV